jgi:hypothetical protein
VYLFYVLQPKRLKKYRFTSTFGRPTEATFDIIYEFLPEVSPFSFLICSYFFLVLARKSNFSNLQNLWYPLPPKIDLPIVLPLY